MTEHERYQADLKAYQDNELPFLRQVAVRRHVATCPACREELMQMTQVTEELRADETRVSGEAPSIDEALKSKIVGSYDTPVATGPINRKPHIRYVLVGGSVVGIVAAALTMSSVQMQPAEVLHVITPAHQASSPMAKVASPAPGSPLDHRLVSTDGIQLASPAPSAPAVTNADDFTRRVHKEATIAVEVDDPEAKGDDIEGKVKGAGGFVAANTLTTGDDGRKTASMTVKVPVAQFETILGQIARLGDVKAKNVTGEDITEQVSDAGQKENVLEDGVNRADARLKQLGKKAKWDDAEAARDLRIQLAQSRARLVLLKKLGDLSEIDVTLTQKSKPAQPPASGFVSGMSDTTHSAFGSLLGAVSALLTVVIWILVYAPIWIPAGLFARWLYQRLRTASEPTGTSS